MVLAVVSAAAAKQMVALEALAYLLLAFTQSEVTFFLSWVVEFVFFSNSIYNT